MQIKSIEISCKCGYHGDCVIIVTGPHNKRLCPSCNNYHHFINSIYIPNHNILVEKILKLCDGDLSEMDSIKKEVGYKKINDISLKKYEYYKILNYYLKKSCK